MKTMVVTRLMDRFDSSFKTRLGISAITVKGQWSSMDHGDIGSSKTQICFVAFLSLVSFIAL